MEAALQTPFNAAQVEILQLFSQGLSNEQLEELRRVLIKLQSKFQAPPFEEVTIKNELSVEDKHTAYVWLYIEFRFMEDRLKNLAEYIDMNQEWLKKEQGKFKKNIKEWEKEHPDSPYLGTDSYTIFEEGHIKFKDFDNAFYSSQVLTAYSYFEIILEKICLATQGFLSRKIAPKELDGQDKIAKINTFINKVLDIDTSSMNNNWEKIRTFQKVRNIFAHSDGQIPKDKKEEFEKIEKNCSGISIEGTNQSELKITDAIFVTEFCRIADEYLREIMKRILKKFEA